MQYFIMPGVKARPREYGISFDEIVDVVCKYYGLMPEQIKKKNRLRGLVVARQVCFYFAKDKTSLSLQTMANALGGRDHTTAIHGIKTINNLIETDEKIAEDIQSLKKIFSY